jgi:hypothetical protein
MEGLDKTSGDPDSDPTRTPSRRRRERYGVKVNTVPVYDDVP